MKQFIGLGMILLVVVMTVIPAGLVVLIDERGGEGTAAATGTEKDAQVLLPEEIQNQIGIKVYRSQQNKVETIPLEVYVTGVVAAEMPAEFEVEALKAQALSARTYIIRRLAERDFSDVKNGAYVTDTISHQVYIDDKQRRERWGKNYEWKMERIRQAVVETGGKVITYDGKPINAAFFSTSNGWTENSEEYWLHKIPYLRSVEVPWDKQSPKFSEVTAVPLKQFQQQLGVNLSVPVSTGQQWSKIISMSTGNRVAKIQVGDKLFTGREIRERLNLPSSNFTWEIKGDRVLITTKGYGHGVGMSQWGANGMAKEGRKAEEIIKYFYQGVTVQDYSQSVHSFGILKKFPISSV